MASGLAIDSSDMDILVSGVFSKKEIIYEICRDNARLASCEA
jgi:hypothetical protein